MSLLQVVEHRGGGKAEIETVPISEGAAYTEFSDGRREVPHWGSHDLAVLASALVSQGMRATNATVTDAFLRSAEDDEETRQYVDEMLQAINAGVDKVEELLQDDFSDFVLVGVTMADRTLGSFRLTQNGQIRLLGHQATEHADDVTNFLRRAILAQG